MNAPFARTAPGVRLPSLARPSPTDGPFHARADPDNCTSGGLALLEQRTAVDTLEGWPGRPLVEEAFRWLLANERARATRAGRPLRLLLVSLQADQQPAISIEPPAAERIFEALRETARDTDVIGWYRQDRVAGVVLTAGCNGDARDGCSRAVLRRVGEVLRRRLPARMASQLRLHALRVRSTRASGERRPARALPHAEALQRLTHQES